MSIYHERNIIICYEENNIFFYVKQASQQQQFVGENSYDFNYSYIIASPVSVNYNLSPFKKFICFSFPQDLLMHEYNILMLPCGMQGSFKQQSDRRYSNQWFFSIIYSHQVHLTQFISNQLSAMVVNVELSNLY